MARIRDIMKRSVVTIESNVSTLDAAVLLCEKDVSFLVVLKDGEPVGVVSERDFVRKVAYNDKKASEVMLREIMPEGILWVDSQVQIEDAVQKMLNNRIRRLVVMDDGKMAGVVTQTDLVSFLRSKILINATVNNIESDD